MKTCARLNGRPAATARSQKPLTSASSGSPLRPALANHAVNALMSLSFIVGIVPGASICANLSSKAPLLSHLGHHHVRRRDFIKAAFVPVAAWPVSGWAQKTRKPVIGLLGSTSAEAYASRIASVRKGLNEAGFVEGQNVTIESRWADGHYERLPALATDLIRSKVDVILAITTPAAVAAKAATTTLPVVFEVGADPVKLGLVASLNKPGGNLTGVSLLNVELGAKRLELLHGVVPSTTIFGLLINPTNSNA